MIKILIMLNFCQKHFLWCLMMSEFPSPSTPIEYGTPAHDRQSSRLLCQTFDPRQLIGYSQLTYTCAYTPIHTFMHIYTCMHIYVYTHIFTHIGKSLGSIIYYYCNNNNAAATDPKHAVHIHHGRSLKWCLFSKMRIVITKQHFFL